MMYRKFIDWLQEVQWRIWMYAHGIKKRRKKVEVTVIFEDDITHHGENIEQAMLDDLRQIKNK